MQEKMANLSNNQCKFSYYLKNEDLILLIMDFLKNEGYIRTYVSLEEESGINLYNYDENLGILRGFILDGDWEEAEKSLEIFKNKKNFPYKNLIFEIRKEKLIEEVEAQQKDGTFDGLAKELKDLQNLGCNNEFNNLMDYLKETEHDVLNETISRRLEIFNKIRNQITFQYPIMKNELNIEPNKLKEIFSKLIEKFVLFAKNKSNDNIYNLKEVENLLNVKIEQDLGENRLDTDPNKNTIIHNINYNNKDSFRLTDNESKNDSYKKMKKNCSESQKKKSSLVRLAETYDDLDLCLQCDDIFIKKNKTNTNKKSSEKKNSKNKEVNKNNKHYNNSGTIKEYNTSIKRYLNNRKSLSKEKEKIKESNNKKKSNTSEKKRKSDPKKNNSSSNKKKENVKKNSNDNNNKTENNNNYINSNNNKNINVDNNGLSDLDEDEYFIKNCYDYYNYDITSLSLKKVIEDSHPIRCCCFSPKGEHLAIGTNSKCLKIYDLSYVLDNFNKRKNIYAQKNNNSNNNTASLTANSKSNKETIGMVFEQREHHHGSIFSIDWSSSGKLLATGSNDKTIKLMNIPDLEENNRNLNEGHETFVLQITGNQGTVRSLCFEPTNDLILLSANTGENTIKIWDTIKGINIDCLEGHTSDVNSIKWSNDAQLFASCGLDKTIRFWDIREHKNIQVLSATQYADINDISIFAKGNNGIIAVGHTDGLVTIWDYSKKCVINEIYEHSEEVRTVAFSPDGKYLLSGSFDSRIKIYDINNNFINIGDLEHGDKVVSCRWHPEIPLIVSTSADKTARIWIPSKF